MTSKEYVVEVTRHTTSKAEGTTALGVLSAISDAYDAREVRIYPKGSNAHEPDSIIYRPPAG